MAGIGDEDQIAYWNGPGGDRWVRNQEHLDQVFDGIAQAILERASVGPGDRVIDIGCGCGGTTLTLARMVAPNGRVVGIDVSVPMLDRARVRAGHRGLPVDFLLADAAAHPFAAGSVDQLFSRFGVMFFDDPVAAFTNLRRALRPGGRATFACWRAPRENPWAMVPLQAAYEHVPKPERPDPNAPGPFAFADGDRVRRILGDAGFAAIELAPLDLPLDVAGGGGLERAVPFALQVGPVSRALGGTDAATIAKVEGSIRQALIPFVEGDAVRLGSAVWLVTAAAP